MSESYRMFFKINCSLTLIKSKTKGRNCVIFINSGITIYELRNKISSS